MIDVSETSEGSLRQAIFLAPKGLLQLAPSIVMTEPAHYSDVSRKSIQEKVREQKTITQKQVQDSSTCTKASQECHLLPSYDACSVLLRSSWGQLTTVIFKRLPYDCNTKIS
jgi:hypothetical protein